MSAKLNQPLVSGCFVFVFCIGGKLVTVVSLMSMKSNESIYAQFGTLRTVALRCIALHCIKIKNFLRTDDSCDSILLKQFSFLSETPPKVHPTKLEQHSEDLIVVTQYTCPTNSIPKLRILQYAHTSLLIDPTFSISLKFSSE